MTSFSHRAYYRHPSGSQTASPLVHCVHIQVEYSGLYDVLIFFCGYLVARGAHEWLAPISREGMEEDMLAYLFMCKRPVRFMTRLVVGFRSSDVVACHIHIHFCQC